MVDRNIVNKLGLSQEELDRQVDEMFTDKDGEFLEEVLRVKVDSHLPGTILKGTIQSRIGNDVIVEVGLKSEGVVDAGEFEDPEEIAAGKEIEVLLEETDSGGGLMLLSKRKADRIRGWETVINTKNEGDVVSGRVIRRIKGGLLVDIGVPVFLPASQVDIRRPGDISRFIGKEVECKVLKIDVEGRNIVVSRRKLIEEERRTSREKIMAEIDVGQRRKGVVKNISDFGVFVDLGGVDGLLHISDLSWGRISHPSEVVNLDEEIECIVIGVDKENEKISLGLKQKTASPWADVEERYPVGARVKGKVVNVMNYGAFVRLEEGIEGLVHISEMSWTRRLAHPSEMLNMGDDIEVVVLNINKEKREVSLGLKQTEINPWTVASQKYPAGTIVTTTVRSLTNFGVFVEIEPGIDGMVHISDLSWTKKFNHPSEMLERGQEVKCLVLEVDEEKRRVSLGIKELTEDPWIRAIPEKYIPGQIIKGTITKLTNFGAFVELEPDLEGLLHISELADHKIDKPGDIVKVGDEVEVKILRIDPESRKIGLSLRRAQWAAEEQAAEAAQQRRPGVQTVLSDTDIGQAVEAQEQEGKPAEGSAEPAQQTEQPSEAVEDSEAEKPKDAEEPVEIQTTEESKPAEGSAEPSQQTEQPSEAVEDSEAEKPKDAEEPVEIQATEQSEDIQKDEQSVDETGSEGGGEEKAESDTDKNSGQ
ncbi:MAG: S1 RNA-binding domain-containing protein [Planctomycetota bacterium]|jgi:small subunit ribosomal protein S1